MRAVTALIWRFTTFMGEGERLIALVANATECFGIETEKARPELLEVGERQNWVKVEEMEVMALAEWRRTCVNGDGIFAVVMVDALRAVYRVPAGSGEYMSGARDELCNTQLGIQRQRDGRCK